MIDDEEVDLKEKSEDISYIKKITSKFDLKYRECGQTKYTIPNFAIIGNCRLESGQGHHSLKAPGRG